VNVRIAEAEVVRLAGLTLVWLLSTDHEGIREQARSGLDHLLAGDASLLSSREAELRAVDDPNIRAVFLKDSPGDPRDPCSISCERVLMCSCAVRPMLPVFNAQRPAPSRILYKANTTFYSHAV